MSKKYISSSEKKHLIVLASVSKIYQGIKLDTLDQELEFHHTTRKALKKRLRLFEMKIDDILTTKMPYLRDGLKIRDKGIKLISECQKVAKEGSFYNNSFFIAINMLFTYFYEELDSNSLPNEYKFLTDIKNYLYIFEKEEKLLSALEVPNENIKIAYDGLIEMGLIKNSLDSRVQRNGAKYLEKLRVLK